MTLDSLSYLIFVGVTAGILFAAPARARVLVLSLASIAFFALVAPLGIIPVLVGTVLSYTSGMAFTSDRVSTRATIAAVEALHVGIMLAVMIISSRSALVNPVQPNGIPAYAFVLAGSMFVGLQVIGHIVDGARAARRGRPVEPHSLGILFAATAYFPRVLAGPIVRTNRLAEQLRRLEGRFTPNYAESISLMLMGLVKKRVIADQINAIPVLQVAPSQVGLGTLFLIAWFRLLQAYFSVSGYIDIARGASIALGIRLPQNFLRPLTASVGFRDFWRRWQVTLMAWFRDYVYRPLRGARRGAWGRGVALIGAFTLAGLWHGPAFAAWGAMMGMMQLIERPLLKNRGIPATLAGRTWRLLWAVWLPWAMITIAFQMMVSQSPVHFSDVLRQAPLKGSTLQVVLGFIAALGVLAVSDRYALMEYQRTATRRQAVLWGVAVLALLILASPARRSFGYVGR